MNNSNVHLLDSETFDENNRLIVNEVLQIKGYSNVYGIGDCVNTKEFKMAAHAEQHGLLIAKNTTTVMKSQMKYFAAWPSLPRGLQCANAEN